MQGTYMCYLLAVAAFMEISLNLTTNLGGEEEGNSVHLKGPNK